jgi:hypothetical protein
MARVILRTVDQCDARVNDLDSLAAQFHRAVVGRRPAGSICFGFNVG